MEKKEPLYTVAENLSWFSHYGKDCRVSSKVKNTVNITQQFTPGYICKGNEDRILKRYMHPRVYCIAIHSSQDMETA